MRALIIFLIAGSVEAKIIEVNYKLLNYKFIFDTEHVSYTSSNVDLSLKKKDCNAHILKSFNVQMKRILKEDFNNKYIPNSYSVRVDGVIKYDLYSTERALFFSNFHDYFKKLKIEESLSCNLN